MNWMVFAFNISQIPRIRINTNLINRTLWECRQLEKSYKPQLASQPAYKPQIGWPQKFENLILRMKNNTRFILLALANEHQTFRIFHINLARARIFNYIIVWPNWISSGKKFECEIIIFEFEMKSYLRCY